MKTLNRTTAGVTAALATLALLAGPAFSQAFPSKPIRKVTEFVAARVPAMQLVIQSSHGQ